jgi:hypothetical protein
MNSVPNHTRKPSVSASVVSNPLSERRDIECLLRLMLDHDFQKDSLDDTWEAQGETLPDRHSLRNGIHYKRPERGLNNNRHIPFSLFGRNEMSFVARRVAAFSTAMILLAAGGSSALAQKKYDPGVTDTEIKIGNIMPYSGPASAYGVIGRTEAAYFRRSTPKAASTAARSTSFPMMTPTVRQKRWSKRASWSRETKFSWSSTRSARRQTPLFKNI